MIRALQNTIQKSLLAFDVKVVRNSSYRQDELDGRAADDMKLLLELPTSVSARLLGLLPQSRAQYRQDLFVLSELGFRKGGYFVEFGATNGKDISNTYLLETQFGWDGIVAEPAKCWHDALRANRRCAIETDCVWRESDAAVTFNEASRADVSTIDAFSEGDVWRKARRHGKRYEVNTISLGDMLAKHKAPRTIDYLSVDTEGSEFDILSAFDFASYDVRIVTVEHNHTPEREKLFELLTRQGFVRKLEAFSKFDDWYVKG